MCSNPKHTMSKIKQKMMEIDQYLKKHTRETLKRLFHKVIENVFCYSRVKNAVFFNANVDFNIFIKTCIILNLLRLTNCYFSSNQVFTSQENKLYLWM